MIMSYFEEQLRKYFNKVDNLTAICRSKTSWSSEDYSDLEIGKIYKISYIGVQRSTTYIMLEGFGHDVFKAVCFDLYEGDNALEDNYRRDFRFIAPYLRERYRETRAYPYTRWIETSAIPDHLHDLENKHGIKIMLAVLSGSRAMGFETLESDWDVFYLFNYNDDDRAENDKLPQGYEYVFEDDVDTFGYELGKCIESLNSGDMFLYELVNQPVLYVADDDILSKIKNQCASLFSAENAIAYYYRSYISPNERFSDEKFQLKELLYYIKGALSCRWIEKEGTMPPNKFEELAEKTSSRKMRKAIEKLIEFKRVGGRDLEKLGIDLSLLK